MGPELLRHVTSGALYGSSKTDVYGDMAYDGLDEPSGAGLGGTRRGEYG